MLLHSMLPYGACEFIPFSLEEHLSPSDFLTIGVLTRGLTMFSQELPMLSYGSDDSLATLMRSNHTQTQPTCQMKYKPSVVVCVSCCS